MSNIELPASLLVFFYVLIMLFCVVVIAVALIMAPDLFNHFKQNETSIGRVYECNKYLDEGDTGPYEDCIREEINN